MLSFSQLELHLLILICRSLLAPLIHRAPTSQVFNYSYLLSQFKFIHPIFLVPSFGEMSNMQSGISTEPLMPMTPAPTAVRAPDIGCSELEVGEFHFN